MRRLCVPVLLLLCLPALAFGQSRDLFDFETAIRPQSEPPLPRAKPPVQAGPSGRAQTHAQVQVEARPQPQAGAAAGETIVFRYARNNRPIKFGLRPQQTLTPAVVRFHRTGINPYAGDRVAVDRGSKLYRRYCAACHGRQGQGGIGPDLTDQDWKYPRTAEDVGQFEIIYGGGNNAMEPFGRWLDQDAILQLVAYLDVLQFSGR